MAEALCGPSNPLQSIRKHTGVDRTLQQDRLVYNQPSSQVRSVQCEFCKLCSFKDDRASDQLQVLALVISIPNLRPSKQAGPSVAAFKSNINSKSQAQLLAR